jgi:hypothetical protein
LKAEFQNPAGEAGHVLSDQTIPDLLPHSTHPGFIQIGSLHPLEKHQLIIRLGKKTVCRALKVSQRVAIVQFDIGRQMKLLRIPIEKILNGMKFSR